MAVPPIPEHGFNSFPDSDKPLTDLYDGWGWHATQAGLQHRRGDSWEVEDADVFELHQHFVSLPCGLVWQMNINWYTPLFIIQYDNFLIILSGFRLQRAELGATQLVHSMLSYATILTQSAIYLKKLSLSW